MPPQHTPPAFNSSAFHCPFCGAFANQQWGVPQLMHGQYRYSGSHDISTCFCVHCGRISLWVSSAIVYPRITFGPDPNPDLPEDIADDYQEARHIARDSPRGAAALLRLVVQKLCAELGEPGKNINDDIASLAKKGLPPQVQQALDVLRVVGNNAVHPGQLDVRDDMTTVEKLFGLVNLVVEVMITQPKHVAEMYNTVIPDKLRQAIDRRDTIKK